jgi:hypothetical protein
LPRPGMQTPYLNEMDTGRRGRFRCLPGRSPRCDGSAGR